MTEESIKSLQSGATSLEAASANARAWVSQVARSAGSVAAEERSLMLETRRAENLARKLSVSAARRNCVGVFGPSQAGKSYLVSVLGRSKEGPLIADFAGTPKNFIKEINPGGGQESTGLVTRFTIVPGTRDSTHPVELRLLTETDLVKILGNSFLSDFSQHARQVKLQPEEAIRQAIARLEPAAASQAKHLDEIAMFDIGEYFAAHFESTTTELTNAGYWEALTRFGARLPTAQRVQMYSMLWGGVKDVTDMFMLMQSALEKLSHAAQVRCVIDGLLPRHRSLINVEVVKEDLGTANAESDLLSVVPELADGSDGPAVKVARATLCALTAELKVVMSASAWPFYQHTDVLDFPGARSREQMIDFSPLPETRAAEVRNMVRRGKVAYLFQRYTEECELASMLLCMPPKPAEVKDLSSLVRDWVTQTHGASPDDRSRLPCALFFVLTFFDQEMDAKPGDTESELRSRIDARMESSMFGLYKHEKWFQDWGGGRPFNNTYFMRNPEYSTPGMEVEERDGIRVEVRVNPDAQTRLNTIREGMLASENARAHFADPGRAWDEAVAPNNGGVAYLVGKLEGVLSPTLKTRQLTTRLHSQARRLDAALRRYYQADDEQSRQKKDDALVAMRKQLFRACSAMGLRNFFQLLTCMKLEDAQVRGEFLNIGVKPPDAPGPGVGAGVHAADPGDPWADDPWSEGAPASAPKPVKVPDRFDHFAHQVINLWTDRVRGVSAQAALTSALGMEGGLINDLASELVIAANRLKLGEYIADSVRQQVSIVAMRPEDIADRCASIATLAINDFVSYLGFAGLPAAERPGYPEQRQPQTSVVFELPPVPPAHAIPGVGERRRTLEQTYFRDWGTAFRQLGLDNLSHKGGREIGEADNRRLGEILRALAPAIADSKAAA